VIVDFPEVVENSPLIIMLHGYGNSASSFRSTTGFEKDATSQGYTVAWVSGSKNPKVRTSLPEWNSGLGYNNNDDVGFLVSVVDYFQKNYNTSKEKVFAIGFSNGAFMTHRLALEASDVFAGVVSVAGKMPKYVWENKTEKCNINVFQITGEKDNVIPKKIDNSAANAIDPAIEDVIEYYVQANGLEIKEKLKIGNSTLEKYKSNSSEKKIFHLLVDEGNHSWPTEQINGIDTNKLILEFLKSI
jgi:poly(3-hydroxybutyrate) depolymerase